MMKIERSPPADLDFTGERFEFLITEAELELEHVHRYVLASRMVRGLRVLDAACGSGYGANILSHVADTVVGIDISGTAIEGARQKYPRPNLTFEIEDACALPYADKYFDAVVSFETLEHLGDQEKLLSEFRRILNDNGVLIISTPEKTNYNKNLREPNPFHVKELEPDEFTFLLEKHFKNIDLLGQRVAFGSLIAPDSQDSSKINILRRGETGDLLSHSAYQSAMYLIALCSDVPLSQVGPEIYEGSIPQNALSSLLGGIEDRDKMIQQANADIEQLKNLLRNSTEAEEQSNLLKELKLQIANLLVREKKIESDRDYINMLYIRSNRELSSIHESYRSRVFRSESRLDEVLSQLARSEGTAREALISREREFSAETDELQARISALEQECDRLDSALLTTRIALEQQQGSDAQDRETSARALRDLQNEVSSLHAELEAQNRSFSLERDDLRNQLSAGARWAEDLTEQRQDTLRRLDASEAENEAHLKQLNEAVLHAEAIEVELQDALHRLYASEAENESGLKKLEEANLHAEAIEAELQDTLRRLDASEVENENGLKKLKEALEGTDKLNRELQDTRRRVTECEVEIEYHVNRLSALKSELAEQFGAKAELEKQLDDARHAASEQLQALADLKIDASERIGSLNALIFAQDMYAAQLGRLTYLAEAETAQKPAWADLLWSVKHLVKSGRNPWRTFREARLLRRTRAFDRVYYEAHLDGVLPPHIDRLHHYLAWGWSHRLDPSAAFNVDRYLKTYPDVANADVEPVYHYTTAGRKEGRRAFTSSTVAAFQSDFLRDWRVGTQAGGTESEPALASVCDIPRPEPHTHNPSDMEERVEVEWKTARDPNLDRSTLGLYDVRPDDAVPIAGLEGRLFMERFGLSSTTPDYEGAVFWLNGRDAFNVAKVEQDGGGSPPDVSIVIPIYGQLAYTLNCLDSLLCHQSRYRFEILVGDDCSPDESGDWLPKIDKITHIRHEKNGGFIDNCNQTATFARGRYVVMLNNDVRVVEGWLDELIGSFDIFPNAGLVGSKLFYDDGSLQEAGGIVWRDGSAWNYGREDDPNRPRYCYARQVDYISGCSIALPMELWRSLEGFDPHYRPAYAEDSDICFRVRARGLETWFQPLSRVIHYEGKTSGTDTSKGIKAYQVSNREKLLERWKNTLTHHRDNGVEPWLERERKVERRVLVIDATNPTPWMDAGSVTTVTTIKIYQRLGYKVSFVPQDNFLYEARQVSNLQKLGVECEYAPYAIFFTDYIKKYGHLFDIIQVYRVGVAEKVLDDLRIYAPQARVIFHTMDLHFLRLEREAKLSENRKLTEIANLTRERELRLISAVDCTVVHSPVEEAIIHEFLPSSQVVVFPYITPFEGTDVSYSDRSDIMFLGGYGHTPNSDAVIFFANEIWPRLSIELPNARYLIVGANPPEEVLALASDRIIVTGGVDALGPWFDRTRVFAATIRYGAGVKGKVSTAMAHGVPVVATDCAAEGMLMADGESVIIANSPNEIIRRIVAIYNDEDEWNRLSRNSLEFVMKFNSIEVGVECVARTISAARGLK